MRPGVILFLALFIFPMACFAPPYTIRTPFMEEEWRQGTQTGTASITGQAFLRTRGGGIRTCAGEKVILMPYNSYTAELYEAARRGGRAVSNPDPRIQDYSRVEVCSAQGDFSFNGLPAGRWLIFSKVIWEVPTRYSSNVQGGDLAGIVETMEGRITKYFLTDEHRMP